jgi:hypothetical protein
VQLWPGGQVPPQSGATPPHAATVLDVLLVDEDVTVLELLELLELEVVFFGGRVVTVVDAPGACVELVLELVVVVLVGCDASVELVVGARGVVVLLVLVDVGPVASGGATQNAGAGAFRAANRPGSSRRTAPPKSIQ